MPLNKKGKDNEVYEKQYGKKKGEQVFYASLNKKKLKELKNIMARISTSINTTSRRIRPTNH